MNDFSMNSLFKNSWAMYKERFWTMLGITLVSMISMVIMFGLIIATFFDSFMSYRKFMYYLPPNPSSFMSWAILIVALVVILIDIWISGSLFSMITSNHDIGPKKSFAKGIKKFGSYFWIGILKFIIIFGIPLVLLIGLPFLVISGWIALAAFSLTLLYPGIMFATWFSLSSYALFKDDLKGTKALKKSKSIVKNNFRSVFWRLFIIGATLSLANFIVLSIMQGPWAVFITILISPFSLIFMYHVYKALDVNKEVERSADNVVFESQETYQQ